MSKMTIVLPETETETKSLPSRKEAFDNMTKLHNTAMALPSGQRVDAFKKAVEAARIYSEVIASGS